MIDATNSMYGLDGNIGEPACLINDGLMEFKLLKHPFKSLTEFGQFMKMFDLGGLNQYFDTCYHAKSLRIDNRNYDSEGYLIP